MKLPSINAAALLTAGFLLTLPIALLSCSPTREEAPLEEAEHGESEGEESNTIELSEAQISAAGIRTETAGPGEIERSLTLPALVSVNADTALHVNPKANGIVRSIHKHLGDDVRPGELLCVIDSTDLGRSVADLVRTRSLVAAAERTLDRETKLFEERVATAERVLDGVIAVNRRIYEREKELQEQAVSTVRPMLEAEKALKGSELDKERQLTGLRAERDTRLLELEVELTERRIDLETARNALLTLGIDEAELESLDAGSALLSGSYEIRASRGGIVVNRHITAGEYVDTETELFTLQDLSTVWILASAFEDQVRSVRTGQAARISMDAFPGTVIEGTVELVGFEVDRESRALTLRIRVENRGIEGWDEPYPLRPGMFGRVELVVGRTTADVAIPEAAIVHEDDGTFVFLRTGPGTFERRRIEVAPPSGKTVEVLSGIQSGDEVVTTGAFQLKSALRRDELGDDD